MKLSILISLVLSFLAAVPTARTQDRTGSRKEEERPARPAELKPPAPPERAPRVEPRQPTRAEYPAREEIRREPYGRTTPIPDVRPQTTGLSQELSDAPARSEVRSVFRNVEGGIADGSVGRFSPYFASQVVLNLRGGESGSFSANQAYYVLENYFRAHPITGFDFSTMSDGGSTPYATGSAGLRRKTEGAQAQVYVALGRVGNRWVITQINIY